MSAAISVRDPTSGPSCEISRADPGPTRMRRSPTSRASASTIAPRAADAASAPIRPRPSHSSVVRSSEGSATTATNPAARAKLRATPAQPMRERAPKQPQGWPARPRAMAPAITRPNIVMSAGAQNRRLGRPRNEPHRQPDLDRDQGPEAERPREGAFEAEPGERLTSCGRACELGECCPCEDACQDQTEPHFDHGEKLANGPVSRSKPCGRSEASPSRRRLRRPSLRTSCREANPGASAG